FFHIKSCPFSQIAAACVQNRSAPAQNGLSALKYTVACRDVRCFSLSYCPRTRARAHVLLHLSLFFLLSLSPFSLYISLSYTHSPLFPSLFSLSYTHTSLSFSVLSLTQTISIVF